MDLNANEPADARRERPLVTAIIIFLNGEKYLPEAIESVLTQTMSEWELILVDDGSTEAATQVARRYAREHPGRIVYTEHPGHENRGMSASRNAGLRLARGKYVGFLDADDIWLPEHLRVYTRILEEMPDLDLVFGRTLLWWSWLAPERRDGVMDPEVPLWTVLEPPFVLQRMLDTYGRSVPAICAIVAKLEAVRAAGGFDDSFRTLYEDQVFFSRLFLDYRSMAIDAIFDLYRQHLESACYAEGSGSGDAKVRPVFLAWLRDHLDGRGVTDAKLRASLARNVWRVEHPRLTRLIQLPAALPYRFYNKLPTWLRHRLARPFYGTMSLFDRKPPPMDDAAQARRAHFMEGVAADPRVRSPVDAATARKINKKKLDPVS